jgi:EmrB/QacA subfamily drug resistance transporter
MTTAGADADGPHLAEPASQREIREVFIGLMIVLALGSIDQNIVATALPRIVGELGGVTHLSWVVTAYVLASTSVMPLYGKLSDQYGRKPMLYVAILLFLTGSVLSGAARSLPQLIAFRAVQGLGAGGLLPLSQIIIGDLVPPAQRGRRQGAIVAVFAVCSVVGPMLGGVITELWSWHWIFYVNLPVGAVALVVIARALRRPQRMRRRNIDYLGAVLLTGATTAFLLVLTMGGSEWPWASPQIGALSAAAALLGLLFVLQVRRAPEPVLPLELFQDRLFLVACLVLALAYMGMMGASLFFPLFFQMVMGVNPSHSGFLTGPLMIGVVVSSVLNGRVLLQRSGRYKPTQIVGLTTAVVAFGIVSCAVASTWSLVVIEPAIFALGFGLGLVMPNMTVAVQNALPAAHRGAGTATLTFCRSLGGLIGVAGSGAILSHSLHQAGAHALGPTGVAQITALSPAMLVIYRRAIATVFVTGDALLALALLAILFLPERPLRAHHHDIPPALKTPPVRMAHESVAVPSPER